MFENTVAPLSAQKTSTLPALSLCRASSFETSKPILPRLIKLRTDLSKIGEKTAHFTLNKLEQEHKVIELWSKAEIENALNQSWADYAFSCLSLVSTLVASITNVGLGLYIGSGNDITAGSALVVAGVCEALRELFTRMGLWDKMADLLLKKDEEQLRENVKKELPMVFALFSFALSCLAVKGLGNQQETLKAVQAALSYVRAGGQTYISYKKANADIKEAEIRTESEHHRHTAEVFSRLVTLLLEETKKNKDQLKNTANKIMEQGVMAAQKV